MKNKNFVVTTLKVLGFICSPATLILAVLWYLQPDKNYEPVTVALGCLSEIFFSVAQVVQRKSAPQESVKKKVYDLATDEILEVINDSSPDDWDVSFCQDAEIAIFKNNPLLRIERRHTDAFIHNDDFREKWANKFLDPHATSYYYHLHYGATRLKEFILVSVDGGRALLPLPKSGMDLSVEPIRYKIAIIFDRFKSCDDYMKRAGLYLAIQK